jgi:ABC-type antimicrobial peptide transport system permease subunit
MNLGLMLLKRSGKQGSLKFVVTLVAAALGTLILLFVFSVTNAVNSANHRSAWRNALQSTGSSEKLSTQDISRKDAVIYSMSTSGDQQTFLDKSITVYPMSFTGGSLPKASPLDVYPKPGEYYVSAALSELLRSYPNDVLKDRFPGKQVGIIPDRALSSPDELLMIQGLDTSKLTEGSTELLNTMRVTDFSVSSLGKQQQEMSERIITIAMTIGAVGLIIPVTMLLTTATALGAREREARYAALRLIGATRRQIRGITFVDSLSASAVGIALGSLLYVALRPILFGAQINGMRAFPDEIAVSVPLFAIFVLVIFGIVWLSNSIAMRGVITSPLGVAKKQKLSKPPRFWGAIFLALCLGALIYFGSLSKQQAYDLFGYSYVYYLLGLFILLVIGLLLSGSWLVKLYGKLLTLFGHSAKGLLVSRRIKHEARKTFQGIGGVVIAFFTGAFFVTSFATIANLTDTATPLLTRTLPDNSIFVYKTSNEPSTIDLGSLTREQGGYESEPVKVYSTESSSLISCHDAKRVFKQTCADMSKYVEVPFMAEHDMLDMTKTVNAVPALPDGTSIVEEVYMPLSATSVSPIDTEKIITKITRNGTTTMFGVVNNATRNAVTNGVLGSFKDLLYAGIVLTIIVASLNLVVATAAGLFDRKGSFFTLRLAGADIKLLESTIIKESLLPLVFISLLSIGLGLYMAYVFLKLASSTLALAFVLPDVFFWICVVAMLVLSYVGIKLITPTLKKLTAIENNRTE